MITYQQVVERDRLTLEEFAWQCLWFDAMRISQFISEWDTQRHYIKLVRRARKNGPVFAGPYGDKSEWAGMVRGWYKHYLEVGE